MNPEKQLDAYFHRSLNSPLTTRYKSEEVDRIAWLLRQCNPIAEKCPRTYIVLRTIGRLDCLEALLREDFGDHWFPLGKTSQLPTALEQKVANEILKWQSVIETDVETEVRRFSQGSHLHVDVAEDRLFTLGPVIGTGQYGQVNRIRSKIDGKEYALKRIRRKQLFGKSKETTKSFIAEKRRMQKLSHKHIVQYMGSYTDSKHLGLMMAPVADCNLAEYLGRVSSDTRATLQTFFGCLATALDYLHSQSIKHRDIKPANILVLSDKVLITDFGISRDTLDTTSGVTAHTPRYCAPEVHWGEKRNEFADVWSLGCVFLEMAAVLHGQGLESIRNYYSSHGSQYQGFHSNMEATNELIQSWGESWGPSARPLLQCIEKMLNPERISRPKASQVWEILATATEDEERYYGTCCFPDEFSDAEPISECYTEADTFPPNGTEELPITVNTFDASTTDRPKLHRRTEAVTSWLESAESVTTLVNRPDSLNENGTGTVDDTEMETFSRDGTGVPINSVNDTEDWKFESSKTDAVRPVANPDGSPQSLHLSRTYFRSFAVVIPLLVGIVFYCIYPNGTLIMDHQDADMDKFGLLSMRLDQVQSAGSPSITRTTFDPPTLSTVTEQLHATSLDVQASSHIELQDKGSSSASEVSSAPQEYQPLPNLGHEEAQPATAQPDGPLESDECTKVHTKYKAFVEIIHSFFFDSGKSCPRITCIG